MTVDQWKIVAAVCLALGIVLNLLSIIFSPQVIITEQSKPAPEWVKWTAWLLSAGSAAAYIALDFSG